MLKCPTCGHSLARLADPCLHCVPQVGRAGASVDLAAAAIAPTSLTLPAELRVPEAPAAAAQPQPAPLLRPQVATVAGRALRPGPVAVQPATAADAGEGARAPATPEPGRAPMLSATVKALAAGLALLVLVVCVSVLRHRDPVPAMPGGAAAGAASAEIAASAVAPDTAGAPTATAPGAAVPLRSTASSSAAPSVTTARLKPRTPTVAHDAIASSGVSPPPPVAATTAAASPRPLAEPVPQAAPEPVVADPREACSKRGFIAAALCINERCAQPRYAGHAECVKLRKAAEDAELALQRGG